MKPLLLMVAPLLVWLAGCQALAPAPAPQLLSSVPAAAVAAGAEAGQWLVASEERGLLLVGDDGRVLQEHPGRFERLDSRRMNGHLAILTVDLTAATPVLLALDPVAGFRQMVQLPAPEYEVEGLCLYQDREGNLFAFLLDGAGVAEQWLIYDGRGQRALAQQVRPLRVAPNSEHCTVQDASGSLFITEEGFGVWRYGAEPESAQGRRLLDALAPFGDLPGTPAGLAVASDSLSVLVPETRQLRIYRYGNKQWHLDRTLALTGLLEPETLAATADENALHLAVQDDDTDRIFHLDLPWRKAASTAPGYARVPPTAETEPVARFGDAADDPAIWVHPTDPKLSRILGTDKKWGLRVYDLGGKQVQALPTGRVNNVDLRQGVETPAGRRDVAVASNRSDNSIAVYAIDAATGEVSEIGKVPTELEDIYGICLYRSSSGVLYTLVNDKDGTLLQFRLMFDDGINSELVRRLRFHSQLEGCVADDTTGQLFVGEEDTGVWVVGAEPSDTGSPKLLAGVGEVLRDDVEGLAIWRRGNSAWLVVSSQGDDSYALFDVLSPHTWRGSFRIGLNAAAAVDGASETDGLAVTSTDLGGIYSRGLLVVQDGRNLMPRQPQNFKLVPWSAVERALDLQPDH